MSLTLSELYNATKHKYQLDLLSEESSLEKSISWVYVSEDLNTFDFLNGDELVITTGVGAQGRTWLYQFIDLLIRHDACGLIINIGPYLKSDDITDEIIRLCTTHNFPLFAMPWNIHIHTLTKDYCSRIFEESLTDTAVTESFLSLLRSDDSTKQSISRLHDLGYASDAAYCICTLRFPQDSGESEPLSDNIISQNQFLHVRRCLRSHSPRHYVVIYNNTIVIICRSNDPAAIHQFMDGLLVQLAPFYPHSGCRIGIGSVVSSLTYLTDSCRCAIAALKMADFHQEVIFQYEDMGFFKILLSVNDTSLLISYMEKYLGSLIEYDRLHNSCYLETLHNYLLLNGSIQAIADTMYCHRNTVNYRVNHLKELSGCALDDMQTRFDYMTAFCIKEYLEIF